MTHKPFAITLDPGSSLANHTGTWRTERPVYVDRLPPCNNACPAGEDIQGWLYYAESGEYERAWRELSEVLDPDQHITPITYINSAADLKAFCGEHGGITCTSSNAKAVIEWCWARREKILFFPDEHLGRNTANKMGIPREQMIVWDPYQPNGGNTREAIKRAKLKRPMRVGPIWWSAYARARRTGWRSCTPCFLAAFASI